MYTRAEELNVYGGILVLRISSTERAKRFHGKIQAGIIRNYQLLILQPRVELLWRMMALLATFPVG
jgi:hypothetical protein